MGLKFQLLFDFLLIFERFSSDRISSCAKISALLIKAFSSLENLTPNSLYSASSKPK